MLKYLCRWISDHTTNVYSENIVGRPINRYVLLKKSVVHMELQIFSVIIISNIGNRTVNICSVHQ